MLSFGLTESMSGDCLQVGVYFFIPKSIHLDAFLALSFSFACPKENETKEKGTTGKATFTRGPHKPTLRKISCLEAKKKF